MAPESAGNEADLVRRALTGDEPAIRELVRYLTPTVQAVVMRYVGGWSLRTGVTTAVAARDELYQEVMMELFAKDRRALQNFAPERGRLKTYVARVAANTCFQFVNRKVLPQGDLPEAVPDETVRLEEHAAAREIVDRLYQRFSTALSPLDLRLFTLLFIQEQSFEDVEKATGISRNALHVRKHRLRKKAIELLRDTTPTSSATVTEGRG